MARGFLSLFLLAWAAPVEGQQQQPGSFPRTGEAVRAFEIDRGQRVPEVAGLPNGHFVAVSLVASLNGRSDVYARLFDGSDPPAPLGPSFQVHDADEFFFQTWPSATAVDGGSFVVCWEELSTRTRNTSLLCQLFELSGARRGDSFKVNSRSYSVVGDGGPSVAALTGGGFVVVWGAYSFDREDGGLYLRRYANDGTPLSEEESVLWSSPDRLIVVPEQISVDRTEDGGFALALLVPLASGPEVHAAKYDSDGAVVRELHRPYTPHPNHSWLRPSVARLSGGGFLVAWTRFLSTNTGGVADVYARPYNASGFPTRDEASLPASEVGEQYFPQLAYGAEAGPGVLSVFIEDGGARNWSVAFQFVDGETGERSGGSGTVVYVAPTFPRVAHIKGGRFAVIWTAEDTRPTVHYVSVVDVAPAETLAPPTSAPSTTAPPTNAPPTNPPLTNAPLTKAPLTNAPLTKAPLTNAPLTKAPLTNAPLTNAPLTKAPLTNAPLTNAPLTKAPLTNAPLTKAPLTKAPFTGAPSPSIVCPHSHPLAACGSCWVDAAQAASGGCDNTCPAYMSYFLCGKCWYSRHHARLHGCDGLCPPSHPLHRCGRCWENRRQARRGGC